MSKASQNAARIRIRPVAVVPSLKERIYAQLKAQITSPQIYKAGAQIKIDERSLAERLRISRTPLREALARLEQEGLVRIVPRKGVFVVRKSKHEILEMIVVWAALESMSARLATFVAGDEEIGSLRTMFATFNDENELGAHIDEYSDANIRFHQRILELGKCALLKETADSLFVHVQAIRACTIGESDRARRSIVDHMHIIEALEARDAELAERLVREHTLNLHAYVDRTWVEPDKSATELVA
jgi:DNA-binding GntR family transcriptional regulator